jgi:hypothetical protein
MHRQGNRIPPIACHAPDLVIRAGGTKRRRMVLNPVPGTSLAVTPVVHFAGIIRGVWRSSQDAVSEGAAPWRKNSFDECRQLVLIDSGA